MDDDVDTDDTIMKNAKYTCRKDIQDTIKDFERHSWKIIHNAGEI